MPSEGTPRQSLVALVVGLLAAGALLAPGATANSARSLPRSGANIAAGERARLLSLLLSGATGLGDAHPTSVQAVLTTYAAYRQHFGGPPQRAGSIYAVEARGHFKPPVKGGRSFTYIVLIVDAKTNRRVIGLLLPSGRKLTLLGPVTSLS